MSHFENALRASFTVDQLANPTWQIWLDYALSSNKRGAEVVRQLKAFAADLSNKRLLDIGSGYGGLCIQAAREGMECVGVEIDSALLALSQENLRDHPGLNISFRNLNLLEAESTALGTFDIITCDNVIEHVENSELLLQVIARLLKLSGFCYLTIPNAFSVNQVRRDCHFQQFGISLLDRFDAEAYLRCVAPALPYGLCCYHPWPYYEAKSRKYGLEALLFNGWPDANQSVESLRPISQEFIYRLEQLCGQRVLTPALEQKVRQAVRNYTITLTQDLEFLDTINNDHELVQYKACLARDYIVEVFYVILKRAGSDRIQNHQKKVAPRSLSAWHVPSGISTGGRRIIQTLRSLIPTKEDGSSGQLHHALDTLINLLRSPQQIEQEFGTDVVGLASYLREIEECVKGFAYVTQAPSYDIRWVENAAIPQSLVFMADMLPTIQKYARDYPYGTLLTCLDVGCGTGAAAQFIALLHRSNFLGFRMKVDAIDATSVYERYVKLFFPDVGFSTCDATNLPQESAWDFVTCSHVIEHVARPREFIDKLRRHSKDKLFIYAPFEEDPANLVPGHINSFDEAFIEDLEPVEWKLIDSLGWKKGFGREGAQRCFLCVLNGG